MTCVTCAQEKSEKEAQVFQLETRAHDVQMLKFGQVVSGLAQTNRQ